MSINNRLIIIGAGGHGRVIADNAVKNGYTDICFVDDNNDGECIGYPIVGKTDTIETLDDGATDFVIGVGDNNARCRIAEKYNVNWVTLVHPSAQIGVGVEIGCGTVVNANAVINVCSRIGKHCIINTSAVVEHDNILEDYVHISPGAALGGTVRIGKTTHIGLGASVKNNISICDDCIIGAGAVVVKDILDSGTYIGVPTRMI